MGYTKLLMEKASSGPNAECIQKNNLWQQHDTGVVADSKGNLISKN